MLYLPLTFVEYNCHNPSSLTGQNNGSIFWFFRRLLEPVDWTKEIPLFERHAAMA
jgi:hypothetical protein